LKRHKLPAFVFLDPCGCLNLSCWSSHSLVSQDIVQDLPSNLLLLPEAIGIPVISPAPQSTCADSHRMKEPIDALLLLAFLTLLLLSLPGGSQGWLPRPPPSARRGTAASVTHRRHPQQQRCRASSHSVWRVQATPHDDDDDDEFWQTYRALGLVGEEHLLEALQAVGLWSSSGGTDQGDSRLLQTLCEDYFKSQQPDRLTRMLQDDFQLQTLQAHFVRTTLWKLYTQRDMGTAITKDAQKVNVEETTLDSALTSSSVSASETTDLEGVVPPTTDSDEDDGDLQSPLPLYKNVGLATQQMNRTAYGLPSLATSNNTARSFPLLRQQVDQFWHEFMTRPNPHHPTATPLRNATARVYVRHANLFLGWYMEEKIDTHVGAADLRNIFPDSSVQSVAILLEFITWLREHRGIAASYEANIWRGLTKLLQFRYTQLDGQPSTILENLPALLQIRKWHREAQSSSKNAPRRSQEERKWLSWEEYLRVVKLCKQEFVALEQSHRTTEKQSQEDLVTPLERRVAVALQRYLILAIFATVPDRQRTIRELEINTSLVKDSRNGMWSIKHSPDAYKTGKTYGERPLLHLHGLTEEIDLFLKTWRPKLQPHTNHLFVQSRTRKPLTQDSVYQIVGRSCYQHTGQRTNPHLLRDMIVTHVRESKTATEQELESLAMLMGHSVAVQRSSYDRRTLTQKVAPGAELMQKVNGRGGVDGKSDC
jgi:hypothetical protein